jgi:hypothetical protein
MKAMLRVAAVIVLTPTGVGTPKRRRGVAAGSFHTHEDHPGLMRAHPEDLAVSSTGVVREGVWP